MKATNLILAVFVVGAVGCQRPAASPTPTLNQGEAPTGAEAEGAAEPAAAAAADGDRNTSTTLGDGTSGMYTGGMGTNGGKATWGTGPGGLGSGAGAGAGAGAGDGAGAGAGDGATTADAKPAAASRPAIKTVGKAQIDGDDIKIPGKIEFDTDKSKIRENKATKEILETLVEVMKENPGITKLRIEGHTDDRGTSAYNHKLSQERAEAVANWLAKHGVDKSRIVTIGLGEEKPIAPNDTPEHLEDNRRTEFKVWEYEGQPTDTAKAATK